MKKIVEKEKKENNPLTIADIIESKQSTSTITSYLGSESFFKGDLYSKGMVRLDGYHLGNVYSTSSVYIAPRAKIKGHVYALRVVIDGAIEGNLFAKKQVIMHDSAKLIGNIYSPLLQIDKKALLKGDCLISEKATETEIETISKWLSPLAVSDKNEDKR